MMATAVQKNSLKGLSNGNGLVHQPLNGYGEEVVCAPEECAPVTEQPEAAPINDSVAEEPEIDIMINNVVCSFSVRCHLNLREIALNGINVEYRKENGKITMKLRRPYTTASIWSSGKVTCTGATSELQAKIAARRFARCLQKLGFKVRFNNYRVVNVLGTCSMPFAIKINSFSERHKEADYEPELHPGVTYKLQNPKATLKIFSTGSVTVT
ncbi:TBP domain containing protein, partial [Asbolus verrucosus]